MTGTREVVRPVRKSGFTLWQIEQCVEAALQNKKSVFITLDAARAADLEALIKERCDARSADVSLISVQVTTGPDNRFQSFDLTKIRWDK